MVTASEVPLSELELGRMDAEYYRPNFIRLTKAISNYPNISIRNAGAAIDCSAFYPSIVPYYNFNREGIPFLRVNEIQDGLLTVDERTAFLPRSVLDQNAATIALCEPGDLIIAKGGNSLGKVALLTNIYPKYSVCRDVLIVRTRNLSKINRFYLWMYLHSEIGQSLLIRTASQTGQPHLTIESVARLKIPLISDEEQDKIESRYQEAELAAYRSRTAYAQAQSLLESELGLDKLTFDKPVSYAARFSEVALSQAILANRIDAQCFSPTALQYEQALVKLPNVQPLRFLTAAMVKGTQQEESPEGTIPYVSIKHIQNNEIVAEGKSRRFKGMPVAKQGDLLLAITGATIGKVGIVSRYEELTFSGDLLAITTNGSINPHYLLAFLSHRIGQVQLQRWITGSTNGHLSPHDVGRVLIPRLDEKLEQRIASLMKESIDKTHESVHLLEQAKHRVEALIEEAIAA